ncbi:MAG TPA: RIP metalloprotease RseP [Candidatus Paceibacterota bacterium]|nr:RIP metalloprotease RseP [Candidatus Paceibacterota bacterium]
MYIIIFLIILAVLVLVHEFGHFFAAKRFGVRVDEFGLGFPPALIKKKVGETLYTLNAVPFGGFVKIFGETPESAAVEPDSRSFVSKPRFVQAVILLAGIIMNVLFAWVLFSAAYMTGMTTGVSQEYAAYIHDTHIIVLSTIAGSPAAKAGLTEGDEVFSLGVGGATTTIDSAASIQEVTKLSKGKPMTLEVLRGANKKYVTVTPSMSPLSGEYAIGISMDEVGKASLPIHLAIFEGAKLTGSLFASIFEGLYSLIHDAILGHADVSQLSGPVGIARLVGDASKLGFSYLLSFTAFISLNLAALNLLPFPALDGGRILFVIIEAIRRKPIRTRTANIANLIGFGLIILLMIFVTYHDILNLVK